MYLVSSKLNGRGADGAGLYHLPQTESRKPVGFYRCSERNMSNTFILLPPESRIEGWVDYKFGPYLPCIASMPLLRAGIELLFDSACCLIGECNQPSPIIGCKQSLDVRRHLGEIINKHGVKAASLVTMTMNSGPWLSFAEDIAAAAQCEGTLHRIVVDPPTVLQTLHVAFWLALGRWDVLTPNALLREWCAKVSSALPREVDNSDCDSDSSDTPSSSVLMILPRLWVRFLCAVSDVRLTTQHCDILQVIPPLDDATCTSANTAPRGSFQSWLHSLQVQRGHHGSIRRVFASSIMSYRYASCVDTALERQQPSADSTAHCTPCCRICGVRALL